MDFREAAQWIALALAIIQIAYIVIGFKRCDKAIENGLFEDVRPPNLIITSLLSFSILFFLGVYFRVL